jgi:hypothetical protein
MIATNKPSKQYIKNHARDIVAHWFALVEQNVPDYKKLEFINNVMIGFICYLCEMEVAK